jgi:hypothetical protein
MAQTSEAQITYRPSADTTPESELTALASVYAYLLKSRESRKGTRPGAPDDAMKGSKDDRARISIYK